MIQNRLKSEQDESQPTVKEKKKKRSRKASKSKQKFNLTQFKNFFEAEKTKQIVGISLLLTSLYLLIAFSSFLFTWKVDQSTIELNKLSYFFNSEVQVENWLGKLGAWISHLFVSKWFGISSFFFVGIFFLLGVRVIFKISLLPIKKTTINGILLMIWLSLFFSYFFKGDLLFLGGGIGFMINQFMSSILGSIGTGIMIFFLILLFLIYHFNVKSWFTIFSFHKKSESSEELNDEIDLVKEPEQSIDSPSIDSALEETSAEQIIETDLSLDIVDELKDDSDSEPESSSHELTIEESTEEESINTQEKEAAEGEVGLEIEDTSNAEEILSDKDVNEKLKEFGEYDPKLDLSDYKMPSIELLTDHGDGKIQVNKEELEANKDRIVSTLENYNIKIQSIKATIGPTVTLYEIVPAPGVRISKIKNLEDDIALSLAALGIRIIAPIPGKGTIGIEVPNQNPDVVSMKTVISSEKFQNSKFDLPVVLGKTISNETYAFDLAKMPHLLMAGATGQGKSVGLNAILTSLLYKKHPSQLKLVLVDPKKVELTLFNKIERHFLAKLPDTEEAIITDNQKVINTLNSLCIEMDERYELLKNAFVRNIKEYNAKFIARKLNPEQGHKYLPYIVLVIDEFADLIMTAGKEVETPIARLAQLARAIGIHLIIATQRPSTNIITGSIKANFPARIAFRVTSGIDSRTILDAGGAEQLIGRGDMLMSTGSDLIRLQCAFVDTPEVEEITEFIGSQRAYPDAFILPEYIDENSKAAGDVDLADRDALFEDAARIIVQHQQGSASLLQRRLKLGYNRAGRIIDQLEAAGIIGPFEGSKARQVLIADEVSLEQFLKNLNENN